MTKLKSAGLPETVILAMIKRSSSLAKSGGETSDQGRAAKATFWFYRENAFAASLRGMPIFVDEQKLADLGNGREFKIEIEPGTHILRCRTQNDAIQVHAEPGSVYYFRAELVQGFVKNQWRVVQISSELDIKRLKPLDPAKSASSAKNSQ